MISKMRDGLSNPKKSFFVEPDPIPQPHFGGLITDPIPAKVRKLEERVATLEKFAYDLIKSMEHDGK